MKLILASIAVAVLTGCASVESAMVICTDTTRVLIEQENAKLLEDRKYIEAHEAKHFGGEVFSPLSHGDLLSAYKYNYNQAVDRLKYQSDLYNRTCVRKQA